MVATMSGGFHLILMSFLYLATSVAAQGKLILL